MRVKEWAGVLAKLQLSFGRVQCVEFSLHNGWPGEAGYRCWYATVYALDGPDAMKRLKFMILKHSPELIPYIRDWELFPPDIP